jgi:hypothetical protein
MPLDHGFDSLVKHSYHLVYLLVQLQVGLLLGALLFVRTPATAAVIGLGRVLGLSVVHYFS